MSVVKIETEVEIYLDDIASQLDDDQIKGIVDQKDHFLLAEESMEEEKAIEILRMLSDGCASTSFNDTEKLRIIISQLRHWSFYH